MKLTGTLEDHPLASRFRDPDYPASYTPFYLYGTPSEMHLEHILLRTPNAQISVERAKFVLSTQPSAAQLSSGLVARVRRPEAALQPFTQAQACAVFAPLATFEVDVYEDPHGAGAHGPGLAEGGVWVGAGTVTFGDAVFVDCERLNLDEIPQHEWEDTEVAKTAPTTMKGVSVGWADVVRDRLKLVPGGGKVVAPPTPPRAQGVNGRA